MPYFLLSIFLSLFSFFSWANSHMITPFANYNLEQDGSPGLGLSYRYQVIESIDIETIYLSSGDLKYQTNDAQLYGDFDTLFVGVNAKKYFTNDLSYKFGGGLAYTLDSSNTLLVEDGKASPYLKFAFDYIISERSSIEFGQISQSVKGELDTSHSLFLGFTWTFGSTKSSIVNKTQSLDIKISKPINTQPATRNEVVTSRPPISPTETKPVAVSQTPQATAPLWYIQFAAYKSKSLAQASLQKYQAQLNGIELIIREYKGFYRIVSSGFTTKAEASSKAQSFAKLSTYVLTLPSQ